MTRRRVGVATFAAAAAVVGIAVASFIVSGGDDESEAGASQQRSGTDAPIVPAKWGGEGVPP